MRNLFPAVLGALLAVGLAAATWAQQRIDIPRIGFISASSASGRNQVNTMQGLRQGLKELGYIEGKSIVLEARFADGRMEQLPALVAELLRLKVDIIVTAGPSATRAAKQATSSVPIVMVFDPDPVMAGFVASLARPGGNITGNANLGSELVGKQMELLKLLLPRMSRIAVLGNSNEPTNAQTLRAAQSAAGVLGLQLTALNAFDVKSIESSIDEAVKARAEALLMLAAPAVPSHRMRLLELTAQHRLPASFWSSDYVESGGLMAYTANQTDQSRRVAVYVDKILKGRKPADLPVELPTRFELVFNMRAAKALGLNVPNDYLLRVERIID